jgi:hypothetical protein
MRLTFQKLPLIAVFALLRGGFFLEKLPVYPVPVRARAAARGGGRALATPSWVVVTPSYSTD